MENIATGQAELKFGTPVENPIVRNGKRGTELRIPLTVKLDDAAFRALESMYRETYRSSGDI